ncbi:hypothetical protein L1765_07960 [Microaerobacter geothermalis]|uniref:hypothetical protein n=1 Tax=Microaerobacter geothermalis TaxID=674972 RepID=UPI001F2321D6|nr:hypothetical protein [Microaerobacter geothermalis]MCF6093904.1 hypothetical protein [Microaerobacter geothermalis]
MGWYRFLDADELCDVENRGQQTMGRKKGGFLAEGSSGVGQVDNKSGGFERASKKG